MFENLLLVINNEKLALFQENMFQMMEKYYEIVDNSERKRIRDKARQRFQEIIRNHKKYEAAKEELEAAAADQGAPKIEEEKKNDAISKMEEQEMVY
jgi:hypothetical protein